MKNRSLTHDGRGHESRDRGQAFTLEAIIASVVVLGALLFSLQVSGVTALSASTASQPVIGQQGAITAGALDTAADEGSLKPTLLYWEETTAQFHRVPAAANRPFYVVSPPTEFGALLNRTLTDRTLAFNLAVLHLDTNGSLTRTPVVRQGQPSDEAARATRTVTLYDDDRLRFANRTRSNTTLSTASFYASDRYPDGPVYAVVRVEVVVWRV
jgi:hypothetical protein